MQANLWRTIPKLTNPKFSFLRSAQFHSTPILLGKNKNDKAQIRFAVREKRADTKKALKDSLLYGKHSKLLDQDDSSNRQSHTVRFKSGLNDLDGLGSKASGKSKNNSSRKGKRKPWQQTQRSNNVGDEYMDNENDFRATFGGQKCYTWSFTWTEHLKFDNWRTDSNVGGDSKEEKARKKFQNESDEEEESIKFDCSRPRIILGLPPTGPLKLEDIKSAFRASALKWHPDRHQGPSQTMAAEKFKICVDAYNSLCSVLKPT